MKLKDLKLNEGNPRRTNVAKFDKLVQSISEFPKMMKLRPIIIDENNVVIGGNMRVMALQKMGYDEIPDEWVRKAKDLTDEERERFVIVDNATFADWDWEVIINDWETDAVKEWGLEVPNFTSEFAPETSPEQSRRTVTDEDIEKAKGNLAPVSKNENARKVVCPHCFQEFEIE